MKPRRRVKEAVLKGVGRHFAVVASAYHATIMTGLKSGCLQALRAHRVPAQNILVVDVPGAFEIPVVARVLARSGLYDAVIALGCVIRGETPHDQFLSAEVTRGLGSVALETGVPVAFGVLTSLTRAQARARSGRGPLNKGAEAALAALSVTRAIENL